MNIDRSILNKIEKAQYDMAFKIERYIKLHIRPKPWWMPERVWHFVLSKFLVLEEFKK